MERKDIDPHAIKTYIGSILWAEIKNRGKMLVPILLKYLILKIEEPEIKEQFLKKRYSFNKRRKAFKKGIKKGKYEKEVPWKEGKVDLPYNRQLAVKKLESLQRKLENDQELNNK